MNNLAELLFTGLGCLILITIFTLVAASCYFYSVSIKRSSKDFLYNNKDLPHIKSKKSDFTQNTNTLTAGGQTTPAVKSGVEWAKNQDYETWQMTSEDGLKLVGYYIPAKAATTKTAVLAHGYSGKWVDVGSFARFYYEGLGYNVFMPDNRGHGQSEGNYIGFGWPDRKDYLQWIQKVIGRIGTDAQIVLHGISMGGATVMMVSGENVPEQVKAVIEDCGYTSVYDELSYQLKRMYKLPDFPLMPLTSILTRIMAGYSFYEASALKQIRKNKLPMLFIHGDEDTFVPIEMVWKLYEVCKTEKEIYIVTGAGHGMAYQTNETEYEKKAAHFVGRYIS